MSTIASLQRGATERDEVPHGFGAGTSGGVSRQLAPSAISRRTTMTRGCSRDNTPGWTPSGVSRLLTRHLHPESQYGGRERGSPPEQSVRRAVAHSPSTTFDRIAR